MTPTQLWQTLGVIFLLSPFVLLQGMPHLTPAWLTATYKGVPGTVWLATLSFAGFVALIWACMRDHGSGAGS